MLMFSIFIAQGVSIQKHTHTNFNDLNFLTRIIYTIHDVIYVIYIIEFTACKCRCWARST
jgi:hypothetical protein